jgi:hypothetical protein
MPLLEVVKVHWPNDGCLSYKIWIPSLELVWFGLLPKMLNIVYSYIGNIHEHKNMPPCSSLGDLLWGSNSPRSIVLLRIKSKSKGTSTYLFVKYIRVTMPSRKPQWWWGGSKKQFLSKKWPLRSQGQVKGWRLTYKELCHVPSPGHALKIYHNQCHKVQIHISCKP